jgi:integrase
MIKFKTVILDGEKNKDDKHNVKIRVTHNRAVRYIRTDYYVLEKFFDKKSELILPGGGFSADDADTANLKIQIQKGQLATKIDKQSNLRFLDMVSLMEILRDRHPANDFYALIDRRIDQLRKAGNRYADMFNTTKNAVQAYYPSAILPLDSITYTFLTKLEEYWRDKRELEDSTISIYMRCLRTIWNHARKSGMVEIAANPFLNYEIPQGQSRENMVLTPEEMATIVKAEIKEPLMRWCRDMYCLMFCLVGVNPKDIFHATKINRGRLFYTRSKGKRKYSVKIPPQAMYIIKRYPGMEHLVNAMDRYSHHLGAIKRINKKLQALAEELKIEKHITIYTCRHSWSAYARYLGISKWDIAAALGHTPIELPKVTEFYDHIEEEQRRVDSANKQVIRLILKTPPKQLPAGPVPSPGKGK